MTTTTDLSPERLDELAQWIEQPGHHPTRAESRALIAMARAKQAAERRVSRLEKHLSLECSEFEEGYQAALAGRDEGYAMAQAAERERDALLGEHSALIGGMIEILESGYDPADEEQLCPLCRGARNDHKDSECLLAIADRTMLDVAAIRGAALAQPTDAGGE